jgi:hypothetical protein
MKRRVVLIGITLLGVSHAGCSVTSPPRENPDRLALYPTVAETTSAWELSVEVRNVNDWDREFRDVTVLGYDETGQRVCRAEVGDLDGDSGHRRTVTVSCSSFPAIVTATTAESPCEEDIAVKILYWVGTAEQRGTDPNENEIVWKSTVQRCNESLPPNRVIQNVTAD